MSKTDCTITSAESDRLAASASEHLAAEQLECCASFQHQSPGPRRERWEINHPVSYTHLTLPTILLV
eukprot:3293956-Amphidinium_carterae.1